MESSFYGFTGPDLIDLRFYCDVTCKTPQELVQTLKAAEKNPVRNRINEIVYGILSQGGKVDGKQLVADLEGLVKLS